MSAKLTEAEREAIADSVALYDTVEAILMARLAEMNGGKVSEPCACPPGMDADFHRQTCPGAGLTEIDALVLAEEVWAVDEPSDDEQLLIQRVLASDWLAAHTRAAVEEERAAWVEADIEAFGRGVAWAGGDDIKAEVCDAATQQADAAWAARIEALIARATRYGSEFVPLSALGDLATSDSTAALDAVKAEARRAAWDEGYGRAALDRYESLFDPGGKSVNPYRVGGAE